MSAYSRILAEPRDLLAWPYAPDRDAQHRTLILHIDANCRLSFGAAAIYEVIAQFDTFADAASAIKAAKDIAESWRKASA